MPDHHSISLLWTAPLLLLLAAIALMPFIYRHWWEHHYPKVALILAAVAAGYYLFVEHNMAHWTEVMEEYVSFVILLGSLYVVSGGILIRVATKATPLANATLLLLGATVANIFGTTGASMLLIRPYLRMNHGHLKPFHVVFFIFLVSNIGGGLTPIGDPPLFLGYLAGVPFWWMAQNSLVIWLVAIGLLLAVFFVIDTLDHGKQERTHTEDSGPAVGILGIHNFLFITLILLAVFQPGIFHVIHRMRAEGFKGGDLLQILLSREILMLAAGGLSLAVTGRHIYEKNAFNYGPMKEVAILFIGIFSTMAPALQWLNENAKSLPVRTPAQYYFYTGTLSAVLDNAPTYKAFLELKLGEINQNHPDYIPLATDELRRLATSKEPVQIDPTLPPEVRRAVAAVLIAHLPDAQNNTVSRDQIRVAFLVGNPPLAMFLLAISVSAVFFGAATYIGNGPNFMVKSIADSMGVQTPGFVGYVVKYSLPILVPLYLLIWALFFLRGG